MLNIYLKCSTTMEQYILNLFLKIHQYVKQPEQPLSGNPPKQFENRYEQQ